MPVAIFKYPRIGPGSGHFTNKQIVGLLIMGLRDQPTRQPGGLGWARYIIVARPRAIVKEMSVAAASVTTSLLCSRLAPAIKLAPQRHQQPQSR